MDTLPSTPHLRLFPALLGELSDESEKTDLHRRNLLFIIGSIIDGFSANFFRCLLAEWSRIWAANGFSFYSVDTNDNVHCKAEASHSESGARPRGQLQF